MDNYTNGLIIGMLIGVPLGLYVAVVSNRHDKVIGGVAAQIFHVIGVIFVVSILPTTLALVFSKVEFLRVVLNALAFVALGYTMLFIHAYFEHPARERAKQEDRGWTAEKAKSSGL